jgi:hypothetical protein
VLASTTGCGATLLFEQPCNNAGAYAEFADLVTLNTNVAAGSAVQVEFDGTVSAFASGVGTVLLQAEFLAGNQSVGVSAGGSGIVAVYGNTQLGGSRTLVVDSCSGCSLPIDAWINISVGNVYCETGSDAGSQACAPSLINAITLDASHTARLTAHYLTPGITGTITGMTGHDYSAVPLPGALGLLAPALGLLPFFRRRSANRKY